jgi:hypothetical protein
MTDLGSQLVVVKDLIQIIFEDMDSVWLKSIWDVGGTIHQELIKIILMLCYVKHRRWWYFRTINSSLYYILVTGLWPIHLEIFLCYDALSLTLIVVIVA